MRVGNLPPVASCRLIFVSLPFAAAAALAARVWTVALPVVFWLVVVGVEGQGLRPGESGPRATS